MFESRLLRRSARSHKTVRRAWPRLRMETLEERAVPAVINWDGGPTGMGTNWLDAANWVGDVLPGANDDAVVAAATGAQPTTLTMGGSTAVHSTNVRRTLQLTTGAFTIGPVASVFSRLTLAGGAITPLDGASLTDSLIDGAGTLTNPAGYTLILVNTTVGAQLDNNGTLVTNGVNSITGRLSAPASSTLRIVGNLDGYSWGQGPSSLTLAGSFTNYGDIELSAENSRFVRLRVGISLTNAPGGTIASAASGSLQARLINEGSVTVGPASFFQMENDYGASSNGGTINVAGTLGIGSFFSGPVFNNTGAITIPAGGSMSVEGFHYQSGAITGEGRFTLGRTATFDGDYAVEVGTFSLWHGTLNSQGTMTIPPGRTMTIGGGSVMNAPLVNQGTLRVYFDYFQENFPSYINGYFSNAAGALLRVDSTYLIVPLGFTNQGAVELVNDSPNFSPAWLKANGPIINAPGGSIATRADARGGERRLLGRIDNQGTITVGAETTWINSGISTNSGTINIADASLTLDQSATEASFATSGTVNVALGRTLTIGGSAFTQTGGTTNVAGNLAAPGGVALQGGTLAGSGVVVANVVGSGILSPGASSTSVFTVNGNYTDTGSLAIDLNGPTVGVNYDQLKVNGGVELNGSLVVRLGYVPALGETFRIISNDGTDPITGTFAGLPEGAILTVGDYEFAISYIGGTGNDVTLTAINPDVPQISQVVVGDGTAQRSRITQLLVAFDRIVSFAGDPNAAFRLNKIVAGAPAGTVAISVAAATVGSHTEATVTFASDTTFGSLNDGRYRLTVLANQVLFNGTPMAADSVTNFHRFYGDVNGDGRIDIADFGFFSSSFKSQTGDARFLAYLDYNGDGRIDITDFGQFSARYFTTLP